MASKNKKLLKFLFSFIYICDKIIHRFKFLGENYEKLL